MDQQTDLLEEGISELDSFVEELNVLTELTGEQLNEHLSLESSVPWLFHVVEPFPADWPAHEQLRSSQVGEDVTDKRFLRDLPELRNIVEMVGVFALDGHVVAIAHLEFEKPFCLIVLDHISFVE